MTLKIQNTAVDTSLRCQRYEIYELKLKSKRLFEFNFELILKLFFE